MFKAVETSDVRTLRGKTVRNRAESCGISKMRNVRTVVDGIKFDSKKEAARYKILKAMQDRRQIRGLKCQYEIDLGAWDKNAHFQYFKGPAGRQLKFLCDFYYRIGSGKGIEVFEDVKGRRGGVQYSLFWLKREIVRIACGVQIVEI